MKKLLVFLVSIVVAVSFFACGKVTSVVNLGTKDYGKGKIMSLAFKTNPSTGYDWEYVFGDGDAELIFDREDYQLSDNINIGGESTRVYYFKANKAGKKTLTYTYRRPWEGGDIAYDVVYDIKVDDDLNITCTAKRKGSVDSGKELSFFPDPVFSN